LSNRVIKAFRVGMGKDNGDIHKRV
jgi:hypothetical protein